MDIRDEIARIVHEAPVWHGGTCVEQEEALEAADRILALPQIAEALAFKAGFATTPEEYRSLTGHSAGKSR